MDKEDETYFAELARQAEAGEFIPVGPVERGPEAQAATTQMLLEASGHSTVEELLRQYPTAGWQ